MTRRTPPSDSASSEKGAPRMRDAKDSANDAAEDAADSQTVERLAQMGFAARGVLFITIGLLAASIGLGSSEDADATGAINQLSNNTFGTIILIVLAIGLGGYALLRLVHLFANPDDEDGAKMVAKRLAYLVQALTYGSLTLYTVQTLMGSGGGGGEDEQSATAMALELPFGQWLVGLAALVLVGVAVAQLVTGVKRDFMKDVSASGNRRTFVEWTGAIGHTARAVLFGTIAWLIGQAALQSDSSEAGGTDKAIQELATTAGGTILLLVVAAGVFTYGVWSLAMAAWGDPTEAG